MQTSFFIYRHTSADNCEAFISSALAPASMLEYIAIIFNSGALVIKIFLVLLSM